MMFLSVLFIVLGSIIAVLSGIVWIGLHLLFKDENETEKFIDDLAQTHPESGREMAEAKLNKTFAEAPLAAAIGFTLLIIGLASLF